MISRPTSPFSPSASIMTVKRSVSKLLAKKPSAARPSTPGLPAMFTRLGKQKAQMPPRPQDAVIESQETSNGPTRSEQSSFETPRAMYRSSSIGNMLNTTDSAARVNAHIQPKGRPSSVSGIDQLLKQMPAEEIIWRMQKEQIQWDVEAVYESTPRAVDMREGKILRTERFVQVQKLRAHCTHPELFALVDWDELLKTCWAEVDLSFENIYQKRGELKAQQIALLFREVGNLAHHPDEHVSESQLSAAVFQGLLPTLNRLHQTGTSDEFHFLIEQLLVATKNPSFRPRRSSENMRQEVWCINTDEPQGTLEHDLFVVRPRPTLRPTTER